MKEFQTRQNSVLVNSLEAIKRKYVLALQRNSETIIISKLTAIQIRISFVMRLQQIELLGVVNGNVSARDRLGNSNFFFSLKTKPHIKEDKVKVEPLYYGHSRHWLK